MACTAVSAAVCEAGTEGFVRMVMSRRRDSATAWFLHLGFGIMCILMKTDRRRYKGHPQGTEMKLGWHVS
jgi:hypothetical protein